MLRARVLLNAGKNFVGETGHIYAVNPGEKYGGFVENWAVAWTRKNSVFGAGPCVCARPFPRGAVGQGKTICELGTENHQAGRFVSGLSGGFCGYSAGALHSELSAAARVCA